MPKDKYVVAGEPFSSKVALKQHAKDILHTAVLYDYIYDPQDHRFLEELFQGYRARRGKPYREIAEIRVEPGWGDSRGFQLYFDDGGSDDISYKNACDSIDGFNVHERQLKKAMRFAIQYQVNDFRQRQIELGVDPVFAYRGEIDHLPPFEFCDLVQGFLDQERISADDIELEKVPGFKGGFLPQELSEKWRLYHLQYARLDLATKEEHERRTRERNRRRFGGGGESAA